jgi:hypothetical protein
MSAQKCTGCTKFTTMFGQCSKCGIKMCHDCYSKGKCPGCDAPKFKIEKLK